MSDTNEPILPSEATAVNVLSLRPGDTLIVHVPTTPTASQIDSIKRAIKAQLTVKVPVIVAGPGVTFEIARPDADA